ncbi:MAG: stage III sporulation protein AD [Cellulosilyticaceae bacterium]
MNILQLVAFAMLAIMVIRVLIPISGNFQIYIRILVGLMITIVACSQLDIIFNIIKDLAFKIKMEGTYLMIIFKIIGIAYIAEFGYQLCKDAGEEGIGNKIQFAAKVMIFVVAAPIILALIELITQLI